MSTNCWVADLSRIRCFKSVFSQFTIFHLGHNAQTPVRRTAVAKPDSPVPVPEVAVNQAPAQ